MNKIYTYKNFSHLQELIPQNSGVYVIIDNNLKDYFKFFKNYNIINIDLSETQKTLSTIEFIADKLLENGADRDCFILGVGGGITTDITGFIASIYKRGVRFGFVPTTLLSQVDAAIGGKNGVNFHSYKNILGTINQPEWIYLCSNVLNTLPLKEFKAGIAEILKTFIIFNKDLYFKAIEYFTELNHNYSKEYKQDVLLDLINKCAEYKSAVVKQDEFEKGERRLLNLGHTFAHAIEKLCAEKGIMHGEAVSIGLVISSKIGVALGLTSNKLPEILSNNLKAVGLPYDLEECNETIGIKMEDLLNVIAKDKKVVGENIHFIIPKEIGNVQDTLISLNKLKEVANDLR